MWGIGGRGGRVKYDQLMQHTVPPIHQRKKNDPVTFSEHKPSQIYQTKHSASTVYNTLASWRHLEFRSCNGNKNSAMLYCWLLVLLEGTGSPDEYFCWKLLKSDQNFLYMRIWFLYLQDAFSKRETNIMFLLDSLKTLTILNVVPETASEFCPSFSSLQLVVSVFAFLQLLVDFLTVYIQ